MGEQLNSKKMSHEEFDIHANALLKNVKTPMKTYEIHEISKEKGWQYSPEVTRRQLERNKNITRTLHPTKNSSA
jgi:hypothetical protein